VQLRLEVRPVRILAAENPFFEHTFIQRIFDDLGHEFEVVAGFVGDAALGVAGVVAGEAIAAAAAGCGMEEAFALGEFAEAEIEEARAMAIDQHDAEAGEGSQQVGERLQVKVAVDEELSAAELRGQVVFAPEVLRRVGEYGFGMGAVAAHAEKIMGKLEDAVEIGAGGFALALTLNGTQSFAGQVFGENRFFFVSFVARRRGLKVEAEGAGALIFELG
jgi:hypothetical protein